MPHMISKQERDGRPDERRERPSEGAPAVSLWLVAAVLAESELLLWALERSYAS